MYLLIDGRQFVCKKVVKLLDDFFVPFHFDLLSKESFLGYYLREQYKDLLCIISKKES